MRNIGAEEEKKRHEQLEQKWAERGESHEEEETESRQTLEKPQNPQKTRSIGNFSLQKSVQMELIFGPIVRL